MNTIIALASAIGPGGVAVIRLSGALCLDIAKQLAGFTPQPRYAHFSSFKDSTGLMLDQGLLIWFPAPHSYTGEDVLELHTHGGDVIPRVILQACLALGARLAEPGEFTRRAYAHGKLDLTQAEAVADLVSATSVAAARGALRSLNGMFSSIVRNIQDDLTGIRLQIEGGMDFPEEGLETDSFTYAQGQLILVYQKVQGLLNEAERFHTLQAGCRVVLLGAPNVGKSSLLNALVRDELAIVSPIAGTTRDTVRSHLEIKGIRLELIDTAGLRDSEELVEKMGIERSWATAKNADLVLILEAPDVDKLGMEQEFAEVLTGIPTLSVWTKADLVAPAQRIFDGIWVSAQSGEGLEALESAILDRLGWSANIEPGFLPRERHLSALRIAGNHMHSALAMVAQQEEFFAEELRLSQKALDLVLGELVSDDLLGEIFSRFCIGK
jgi:tRNA modification GTPase